VDIRHNLFVGREVCMHAKYFYSIKQEEGA